MAEAGLRILVVEDHHPLGRFIDEALTSAGWMVSGPLREPAAALHAAQKLPLDLAVVDRRLAGAETFAVVAALAARGIPCLLMSGYARATLPEDLRDLPFLEKPFTMQALLAAVRDLAGQPR
jgi:DNA-binding response OmpR family regulator